MKSEVILATDADELRVALAKWCLDNPSATLVSVTQSESAILNPGGIGSPIARFITVTIFYNEVDPNLRPRNG